MPDNCSKEDDGGMTLDEIKATLEDMGDGSDEEICHSNADDMLLLALEKLGRADIAKAFTDARDRVGFWYA
jgi:hypothetical protein